MPLPDRISVQLQLRRRLLACGLLLPCAACSGGVTGTAAPTPSATQWRNLAPLADGPRQECGVAALGGEIYVVGGFDESGSIVTDVEAYDVANDRWRRVAPLPAPLHHVNVAVVNNRLYVAGALRGMSFTATGITLEYDPATNAWTQKTAMPTGTQRGASAVASIGNLIYIAGGARGGAMTEFSFYDVVADRWQSGPALPVASEHFVGAAVSGVLYAIGGRNANGLRNDVQIYDPAKNTWTTGRPLPTARGGIMGAAIDGRIHIVGGEGNRAAANGIFDQHEAYDVAADTWTTLEPMRTPRHGTGAAAIDGVLYVPGGATREGFGAVATNEAFAR
jgi:N-acetylneuraminic acid mutarotase